MAERLLDDWSRYHESEDEQVKPRMDGRNEMHTSQRAAAWCSASR